MSPPSTADNPGGLGAGRHSIALGFESLAIHAGQAPDPSTGAVVTPIFQTSTFAQSAVGQHLGYDYARTANPTRSALERCLAALEGATYGLAFASGMAAAASGLMTPRCSVSGGGGMRGTSR